ncbi:MAG: class I SAM-dependent methyltransferase [Acidobacteriia bacterium]|nr:class I SAM-dependent methyltransferase [Terriglobia bacterium]
MRTRAKRLLRSLGLALLAFRMREWWRARSRSRRRTPSPDGFPIPPPELIVLVTGSADTAWYTEGGGLAAESICGLLGQAGISPHDFRSILDFGCGCGRVIRHWPQITSASLHGTDCNPKLVQWCGRNLPYAKFQSNTLEPRLDYADEMFEFAYALSVFTHTPEDLQQPWMTELRRILRPGGYLLITTQGDEFSPRLDDAERDRYRRGNMVVRYGEAAGTNLCSVYHPEPYVRDRLAETFTWIMSNPRGAAGNGRQDMYLLRKPNEDPAMRRQYRSSPGRQRGSSAATGHRARSPGSRR